MCKIAGFLSFLSGEVSAFNICLITIDRFLVLKFPFSKFHFSKNSALAACGVIWCIGILLASIPLLPITSHWQFYSQTSICTPLPFLPQNSFPGYSFAFAVMININFILFLLIALGQLMIYSSVIANSMNSESTTKTTKEARMARRLITIAVSDFLCWFPVGFLGVLAYSGVSINTEVNVAVAIFILPINAAFNPFLYTINILLEKRQQAQEKILMEQLRKDF